MRARFDRGLLPDPLGFYEGQGLALVGSGPWRTTRCCFHGGSDSMRVNVKTGAFRCMNCGASGGDVVVYAMKANGWDFMEAARKLGAMVGADLQSAGPRKTTLAPAAALRLIQSECWLIVCTLLSTVDLIPEAATRDRLIEAACVVQQIMSEVAA